MLKLLNTVIFRQYQKRQYCILHITFTSCVGSLIQTNVQNLISFRDSLFFQNTSLFFNGLYQSMELLTTTHNHPLPSTTIHNHPQPSTSTHNHPQPPTTIHNHPHPPTTIHNDPQPSSTTHNHPQPSITIYSYPKLPKTIYNYPQPPQNYPK